MESLSCLNNDCLDLLRRHELLRPLVRAELISQTIASVTISNEEEAQLLGNIWKQNGIKSEDEFNVWLRTNKTDKASLLDRLSVPLRLERYCQTVFGHRSEMRFLERKQHLDQVVYSLIRIRDHFKARELYLRISDGEAEFADIASMYSEGIESKTRGIVGPVPLVQGHPMLVERLRSTKPGEMREPIQVEGWNLIVRLESVQPAVLDDRMASRMAQELFSEWVEEQVGRKIEELSEHLRAAGPLGKAY